MEFAELKLLVSEARQDAKDQRDSIQHFVDEQDLLLDKVGRIYEDLNTSPDAESAASIANSMMSDSSGLLAQTINLYDFLDEIYTILNSL